MNTVSPLNTYVRNRYQQLAEYEPILLKQLEPRRILTPQGYSSVDQVPVLLHDAWQTATDAINQNEQSLRITPLSIVVSAVNEHVPIFFLSEALAEAIINTDIPDGIRLEDLHWPRSAFVLGLPQKLVTEYAQEDTGYIVVANLPADELKSHILKAATIVAGYPRVGTLYTTHRKKPELRVNARSAKDLLHTTLDQYSFVDCDGTKTSDETKQDAVKNRKLLALVLKTLLVMAVQPSLITYGECQRKEQTGRKPKKALWKPNFIGLHYQSKGTTPNGHSSPGIHRRRGHLTHQPIGKQNRLIRREQLPHTPEGKIDWDKTPPDIQKQFWETHKLHWIEPLWVGLSHKPPR